MSLVSRLFVAKLSMLLSSAARTLVLPVLWSVKEVLPGFGAVLSVERLNMNPAVLGVLGLAESLPAAPVLVLRVNTDAFPPDELPDVLPDFGWTNE